MQPSICMMYSEYRLNKQGDSIQPWRTPFPIWNQSIVPYLVLLLLEPELFKSCCFLTCIQISQEAGKVIWYSHPFKNFPVYCDPHSHRLLHSQWNRSGCFSGFPVTVVPDDSPDLFLFLSEAWRKVHLSRAMRLVLASGTQVLGFVSLPGCGI